MGLGDAVITFTAFEPQQVPPAQHPRWAVLGRSNVGKSSFLNALLHPFEHFRTGKTPGVTRGLIGCQVRLSRNKEQVRLSRKDPGKHNKDDKSVLELVDLPGFGFAKVDARQQQNWNDLADTLREQSGDMPMQWIWLADPSRAPDDEERMLRGWLGTEPYTFIFTKADRVKKSEEARALAAWKDIINGATEGPFWTSSSKGTGFDAIFKSARNFVRTAHEERE